MHEVVMGAPCAPERLVQRSAESPAVDVALRLADWSVLD
jgi:hypothetical protein